MKNKKTKGNFLPTKIEYNPNKNALDDYFEDEFTEDNPLDISSISIEQLGNNINQFLNKKPSLFLFIRNRENKKIKIETEKLRLLVSNISSLRGLRKEILELRADTLLTNQVLDYLIYDKKLEFEQAFERKVEEHNTFKHIEKNKRIQSDLENDRNRAEIEEIRARTFEQKERAKYLRKARKDYETLPPAMKAYMFAQMFGKNPEQDKNFEMEDKIVDYMKKRYDIEIQQLDIDTEKKIIEKDQLKDKFDRNRKI